MFLNGLLQVHILSTSCEIGIAWVPHNPTDDKSTFVHVMTHAVPLGNKQNLPGPILTEIYDDTWRHKVRMS